MFDLRKRNDHDYYILRKFAQAREGTSKVEYVFQRSVVKDDVVLAHKFARKLLFEIYRNVRKRASAPRATKIGQVVRGSLREIIVIETAFLVAVLPTRYVNYVTEEQMGETAEFSI